MSKRAIFFLTVALVVGLDQTTKHLASAYIDPYEPVRLLPFLNLVNVRNVGAAFGLFSSLGNAFFMGVAVLAMAFILWLIVREENGTAALSLMFAGATGNLIDRALYGHVRDFIDVHAGSYHWPAFNLADSALTVGIVVLIAWPLLRRKPTALPEDL